MQHYYRDAFVESHRKPRDVPEISLFCSVLALIPQSGDFSGAALGVRSVALLQVAKLAELLTKGVLSLFVLFQGVIISIFYKKNTRKTSINSTFATKTVKNLHICNFCSTFAAQRSRLNDHGVSR